MQRRHSMKTGGQLLRQQNAWRVFQISWQRRRRAFLQDYQSVLDCETTGGLEEVWIKRWEKSKYRRNEIDGNSGRADRREIAAVQSHYRSGKLNVDTMAAIMHRLARLMALGQKVLVALIIFLIGRKVISMIEKMLSRSMEHAVWMWV